MRSPMRECRIALDASVKRGLQHRQKTGCGFTREDRRIVDEFRRTMRAVVGEDGKEVTFEEAVSFALAAGSRLLHGAMREASEREKPLHGHMDESRVGWQSTADIPGMVKRDDDECKRTGEAT